MNRRKLISGIVLGLFVAVSILIAVFFGPTLIEFVKDTQRMRAWVEQNGPLAKLGYIGMVVLQIVIAVIPGEPIEFAAGYAFGAYQGALLTLIGAVIGSFLVFLLVRKFGVKLLEAFFPMEKINELKFLKDSKRLNSLIFLLFLIPATPKDLLTYVAPLTKVNLWWYLLISNVARIPSVISSTIAGGAAGEQDWVRVLVVYGITAVAAGIGVLVYRKIQSAHSTKDAPQEDKKPK